MANEEILAGLKRALENKESLRDAMMSFYNSGYGKKEIEDAAAELQRQQNNPNNIPESNFKNKPKNKSGKPINKNPVKQKNFKKGKNKSSGYSKNKNVSNYSSNKTKKKSKKTMWVILLIITLGIIFMILAGLIILREDVINFFNNLF